MRIVALLKALAVFTVALNLSSCVSRPEGVTPVQNFEIKPYLGTWYEVARLDHSFERGMNQVTATYSMREDGGVAVLNRGYHTQDAEWQEAEGKAYFVGEPSEGFLKVSFFGPFYGAYVVFELDHQDYQYAYVAGPNKNYLWLLSRTPSVSKDRAKDFVERAKSLGFPTDKIIWVDQQ